MSVKDSHEGKEKRAGRDIMRDKGKEWVRVKRNGQKSRMHAKIRWMRDGWIKWVPFLSFDVALSLFWIFYSFVAHLLPRPCRRRCLCCNSNAPGNGSRVSACRIFLVLVSLPVSSVLFSSACPLMMMMGIIDCRDLVLLLLPHCCHCPISASFLSSPYLLANGSSWSSNGTWEQKRKENKNKSI